VALYANLKLGYLQGCNKQNHFNLSFTSNISFTSKQGTTFSRIFREENTDYRVHFNKIAQSEYFIFSSCSKQKCQVCHFQTESSAARSAGCYGNIRVSYWCSWCCVTYWLVIKTSFFSLPVFWCVKQWLNCFLTTISCNTFMYGTCIRGVVCTNVNQIL
jgi:hypothetical protein